MHYLLILARKLLCITLVVVIICCMDGVWLYAFRPVESDDPYCELTGNSFCQRSNERVSSPIIYDQEGRALTATVDNPYGLCDPTPFRKSAETIRSWMGYAIAGQACLWLGLALSAIILSLRQHNGTIEPGRYDGALVRSIIRVSAVFLAILFAAVVLKLASHSLSPGAMAVVLTAIAESAFLVGSAWWLCMQLLTLYRYVISYRMIVSSH